MKTRLLAALATALLSGAALAVTVAPAPAGQVAGPALPMRIGGRVAFVTEGVAKGVRRQWPGTYFETAFTGTAALLTVGPGNVVLRVRVDDAPAIRLFKPAPGRYRIGDLPAGPHRVRVDVASESQAGPTIFGGFQSVDGASPLTLPTRTRRIEFIGDSHTVGYANLSTKRDCSEAEVWDSTDTSQGIAPRTAARYDADYRVNAISGRGVVRNYDGGLADTLPTAYPFLLFDKAERDATRWHPQLIVIALGTNDFTTALHPGEKWANRDALHADYETRYRSFIRTLRKRDPQAHILIWATDMANGEIAAEAGKVVERIRKAGDRHITFMPVNGLAMSSCHAHPSTADDSIIADRIAAYVDAHPDLWGKK